MAGRETVTITEFSNGNGSADSQARSVAWIGVGWCGSVWGGGMGSIKSEMAQRRWLLPLCVGGINVGVWGRYGLGQLVVL